MIILNLVVLETQADTFWVTTTVDDYYPGTIDWAISDANTTAGTDTVAFNIPGGGPHTIMLDFQLEEITDPVVIDGYRQPGASPATPSSAAVIKIELDGSLITPNTFALDITAGNSTVRGLAINNCQGHAIRLRINGGNKIQGNYIGTDPSGTIDRGNTGFGIAVFACPDNTIGGTSVADRNIISGNDNDGIYLGGDDAANNVIQGNYIGTDVTGTISLSNQHGIHSDWASNTLIGGTEPGAGNVISGNLWNGVWIRYSGATGSTIQGNYIGTDPTGTLDVGNNANGVGIENSSNHLIGGTASAARNILSGNEHTGIWIAWGSTSNITVQGNYIGTDVTGTVALGNSLWGVGIDDVDGVLLGGAVPGARNIISGNTLEGVNIYGGATNIQIQGNYIGTNVFGNAALANGADGIEINDSPDNTVGGSVAGMGNLISGNDDDGVFLYQSASGAVIQGNIIGLSISGISDLGNAGDGIDVMADSAIIGGNTSALRNVISGNGDAGIAINWGTGTVIQGNYIGTSYSGTGAVGNDFAGVRISDGSYVLVGGTDSGEGNLIAHNGNEGIAVESGLHNRFLSNASFDNSLLGIDLGGDGVTVNDGGDPDSGANGLQNYPVLASATAGSGHVTIEGSLNSTPSSDFLIQFFANEPADPTGYGEGERYLGATSVTTNAGGDATFSVTLAASADQDEWVTATATSTDSCTSEFGLAIAVGGMELNTGLDNGELTLSWSPVPGTDEYWVYGASNKPFFQPGFAPGYEYRIATLPSGTTSWSSSAGVGDENDNMTYLVIAVDAMEQQLGQTNRAGEFDF